MSAAVVGLAALPGFPQGSLPGLWLASSPQLVRPLALLALLAVPLLWWAGRSLARWRQRTLAAMVHPARAEAFVGEHDRQQTRQRLWLSTVLVAAVALALAGPQWGRYPRRVLARSIDLVVCLDTSRSMLARDQKPSRFERMQREVKGLLERLEGDRVALLAFAGDVREIAPLTRDRAVLAELLDHLDMADNRLGGTDLGAALESALRLFDGRSGAHEAVVLLTDGGDLSGHGLEVAAQAKARGIRVYVVGIGTSQGGKIPLPTESGERFLVGPDGQEVVTRLEEAGLQELARLTGGDYTSTERSPTPLEELYTQRLSRLDRRQVEGGIEEVPIDRSQWPLGLACLTGLWAFGLSERRRRSAGLSAATAPQQWKQPNQEEHL
jgi:Ca-activated chloride channel family protein